MSEQNLKGTIEAILFAAGREVSSKELSLALEKSKDEIEETIYQMNLEYKDNDRGIEIIKTGDNYQLATRKEYYEQVYKIIDKRNKPKLSNAAIETLSIIAYNPRISRAEIESIRGVNVDGTMYKLLEYGLIEEAGKLDLPGKPMSYKTTNEFLKMFGYSSLNDLPKNIINNLTSHIEILSKKYDVTFSDLEKEIKETEKALIDLTNELTGSEYDMLGLNELKAILGGSNNE